MTLFNLLFLELQKVIEFNRANTIEELARLRVENRFLKTYNEIWQKENEKLKIELEAEKKKNKHTKTVIDFLKFLFIKYKR